MMRILLVGNYVPDGQTSMQLYASLLQKGIAAAGHEVRLLSPPVIAGKHAKGIEGKKWLGYVDKFVLFPKTLKNSYRWADVVHVCDHSNASYLRYIQDRPHVITCHDMLAIRAARGEFSMQKTRWTGRRLQSMILRGLANATNVVCVSDATRNDLVNTIKLPEENVVRIYNGLNHQYHPMENAKVQSRLVALGVPADRPFLLHVGSNVWYKNRLGVLKIFAEYRKLQESNDLLLIMAGEPFSEEMQAFIQAHDLAPKIIQLTYVSQENLCALYSGAEALLFPSLQEGFGWPIAEANACGCPVVTTNRSPMTEIGGSCATYVDPLDYRLAAQRVAEVVGTRHAVLQRSLENAARFDSSRMLDAYLKLYSRLAEYSPVTAKRVPAAQTKEHFAQ